MKKLLLSVLLLVFTSIVFGQTSTRWKPLFAGSEFVWDTESAIKIDVNTVRFWYEYPILEEQRTFWIKNKAYSPEEASTIVYGRTGVVAKCKSMQSAIFSGAELNANKNPLRPSVSLPLSEVKFSFIEPDTVMEAFVIAVCKHLKMK